MQRAIQVLVVMSLSFAMAVGISAQEKKVKPKEVTVTGRIVDSECYMKMGEKGYSEEHHECAESCAKGGIPLMFLEDKTNDLYLTANDGMSMKSANETLLPYLDDKVTITGKLVERSGARLLVLSSIEKAK
jgi:hypothetical protein